MLDAKDQIKERLSVVDVIREYLKLEPAGSNYKALCPFHNEKTPSFMVNPERNFWYCFGCQKGGDVFSFLMELEGIEFREALERLAEKAGVELPKYSAQNRREEKTQLQKIQEVLELSTRFFEYALQKAPKGNSLKEYLHQRKVGDELIKTFRIGYSPNGWKILFDFLVKRGYDAKVIEGAGLAIHKEDQQIFYDRFRDRIMFPISDISGKVVGFSARVAPGGDEKSAKYINTPATIAYDKSKVLYGLYQAKPFIKRENRVVIVEGNMDVIASHADGVNSVVAISGTALSSDQIRMLKRYTNNFLLCFDMDEAGQNAVKKSIHACLREGVEVEIVLLPKNVKDVNDLVIMEPGKWPSVVSKSFQVMEYFFQSALSRHDISDPKGKKNIAHELLSVIKNLSDPIEKNFWLVKLASIIGVGEEVLLQVLEKIPSDETGNAVGNVPQEENPVQKNRYDSLQQRAIGLYNLYQLELEKEAEAFDETLFKGRYADLWRIMRRGELRENKDEHERELNNFALTVRYSYDKKTGFTENDINPSKEWTIVVKELEKERKKEALNDIMREMKKAEEMKDEQKVEELMKQFSKLTGELDS